MTIKTETIWTLHHPETGQFFVGNVSNPEFSGDETMGARYFSMRQVQETLVNYHATRLVRGAEGSEGKTLPMFLQFRETYRVTSSMLMAADIPDVGVEAVYQIRLKHLDYDLRRPLAWMRTREDSGDWHFAIKMPRWMFDEGEDEIEFEQGCERVGLPILVSDPFCFVKREEDVSTFRLMFSEIEMIIGLDEATVILDNREKDADPR